MPCYDVTFEDCPGLGDDWLSQVQPKLFEKWSTTTGHKPGASSGTWACEIAHGCRTCNEHLSLPCSLLAEANEVGAFLSKTCYADDPAVFLRLYFLILSEFVGQLDDVAGVMGIARPKRARSLAVWGNRWAKHRLHFLVLHHPGIVFSDRYEQGAEWLRQKIESEPIYMNGRPHPALVIDTPWLESAKGGPTLELANADLNAIVLVPPMAIFLEEAIATFRSFVDAALQDPEAVKRFESPYVNR